MMESVVVIHLLATFGSCYLLQTGNNICLFGDALTGCQSIATLRSMHLFISLLPNHQLQELIINLTLTVVLMLWLINAYAKCMWKQVWLNAS